MANEAYALEMRHIIKRFLSLIAVNDISLQVKKGEVHAICGENGAGKSTLMKVLAGEYTDYEGQVLIGGKEVRLDSPLKAREVGVAIIHQELGLARPISVAENILAGCIPRRAGIFINKKEMNQKARRYLDMVGLNHVKPSQLVSSLSQHEAQLVEIAKALSHDPQILIMDEPTSSLSREESKLLFSIIEELKSQGLAILYISHFLSEVFQVSDYITTMRDGCHVATRKKVETNQKEVIRDMVGQDVTDFYAERNASMGKPVIEVKNLTRYGFFKNISFDVHEGEIFGICGLTGAGRSEIAKAIVGIDQWDKGEIRYMGKSMRNRAYVEAIQNNIAYLAEDRKLEGLLLTLPISENIASAKVIGQNKGFWAKEKKEEEPSKKLMEDLAVRPMNPDKIVGQLSGGNQQKVLLAKWLLTNPKLLILDEPTRGVDVGAKSMIHEAVRAHADKGNAIILISSDLMELGGLSDRVMIIHHGLSSGILDKETDKYTEASLLLAANRGEKEYEEEELS